jgi:hypothetical protein
MLHGAQQASASSTAGPRPKSTAILQSDQPPRAAAAREGGRGGTGPESLVRGSVVAPCVSCGICGGLLRDATAFTECLHACKLQCDSFLRGASPSLSMWASWPPGMGMASLSLLQFACSDWVPFDFDIAIGVALAVEPLSAITLLARMFCRFSMAPLSAFKKERKKQNRIVVLHAHIFCRLDLDKAAQWQCLAPLKKIALLLAIRKHPELTLLQP